MKNLLTFATLLFCAGIAQAQTNNCPVSTTPWTCTQGAQNFVNGGSVTSVTATTATPIANNSIISVFASACWNNTCTAGTGTIAITDNGGSDSYICPTNDVPTGVTRIACYICLSAGGPTGITATMTPAATSFFPQIIWNSVTNSGATPSSCLDQKSGTAFTSGSGTSAAIQTSSPTTKNNDLIWSALAGPNASTNNSFQYLTQSNSNAAQTEMKNGATPGTYPTGWTFSSGGWAGVEFAFFGPASGSPGNFPVVIKFRRLPHHQIPWDDRKRKLEIVTI